MQAWFALALAVSALAFAAPLSAQQVAPDAAASSPPRALSLPELSWPPDVSPPTDGALEALLIIGTDGVGQVEGCAEDERVCDALRAALLEARFVPAQVAGQPSAARVRVRFRVRTAPPPV